MSGLRRMGAMVVAGGKQAAAVRKANAALRACQELGAEARWAEMLALTGANPEQLKQQPKIAIHRLAAAAKLKDAAAVSEVTAFAKSLPSDHAVKFSLVRELTRAGHPEDAASILLDDPAMKSGASYFAVIKLVNANLKDVALKRALQQLATSATGGGINTARRKAKFAFKPQRIEDCPLGTVHLASSPTAAPHHQPALTEIAANFAEKVAGGLTPAVRQYNDVFVDRGGQIWDEEGRLLAPGGRPIPTTDRTAVETVEWGLVMLGGTKGIYHWMVDRLPALAWLNDGGPGTEAVAVLCKDEAPTFERTTLEMLGVADRVKPVGDAVFVKHLLLARIGFAGCVGWSHLQSVYGRLVDVSNAEAARQRVDLPSRIYISRRDAKRRRMTNEAELEKDLKGLGFSVYEFSRIPLWHQIALVNHASVVAAPHGAGLAHIINARPGTRVVEILPLRDGTYPLRFNYARLSIIKGLHYNAWLEEQNPSAGNWQVDRTGYVEFLKQAIA